MLHLGQYWRPRGTGHSWIKRTTRKKSGSLDDGKKSLALTLHAHYSMLKFVVIV